MFGEYIFCITRKDSFVGPKVLFLAESPQARLKLCIHLERDSMPYVCVTLYHILSFGSSGLNCEFIRREYGFSINSEIPLMSSGDKPILTLKISITIFLRFQYFADFDIKITLLDQNSFC